MGKMNQIKKDIVRLIISCPLHNITYRVFKFQMNIFEGDLNGKKLLVTRQTDSVVFCELML